MAALNISWTDFPPNTIVSAHDHIKVQIAFNDGVSPTAYTDIISVKFRIREYDSVNEAYLDNKDVYIRVQPYVGANVPWDSSHTWNTTHKMFSLDVSPIIRDRLSYDLRPCHQDTSNTRRLWDISQMTTSFYTFKKFSIEAAYEYLDANGVLQEVAIVDNKDFYASNTILEENLIEAHQHDTDRYWLTTWYLNKHSSRYNATYQDKIKFFTDKPTTRLIREDECEYISFWGVGTTSYYPHTQIQFFNSSGSLLDYATINQTSVGDGTYTTAFQGAGVSGVDKELIMQAGIGTRNISNIAAAKFGLGVVINLSTVSYYTVQTKYIDASTGSVLDHPAGGQSELITYNIDRETKLPTGVVRFHWQNRKGGVDSYTAKGGTMESLVTSSTTYEKTIHPQFGARYQSSTSDSNLWDEAVVDGVGGATKNEYAKLSKLNVISTKEFSSTTRPLNMDDARWLEDLLVSPNVWIEVTDDTLPSGVEEQLYVPIVIKDGTTQIVDSEGLTTIEIKYALSKPRKTHSN